MPGSARGIRKALSTGNDLLKPQGTGTKLSNGK